MAKGVNKVILIGHLGGDPEVRYTGSGAAVATISLATTHGVKNKQTGEWQDQTEWHRVVFFNKQAEITGEYLRKGSQVYVEGRLRTQKWQDQNGVDRYTTEIVAQELQMLGSKGGGESQQTSATRQPVNSQQQQPAPNYDDDIAF